MTYEFTLKSGDKRVSIQARNIDQHGLEIEVLNLILEKPKLKKSEVIDHLKSRWPGVKINGRRVQLAYRNLRECGVPVITCPSKGAWVATDIEEIRDYCKKLQEKIIKDTKSSMKIYQLMSGIANGAKPSLFGFC